MVTGYKIGRSGGCIYRLGRYKYIYVSHRHCTIKSVFLLMGCKIRLLLGINSWGYKGAKGLEILICVAQMFAIRVLLFYMRAETSGMGGS